MKPLDFDTLRSGAPDCPSDLQLDRYVAEELDASTRAALEQHLATCKSCPARVEERRAGWSALPVDPRPMLAAIRRAEPVVVPWWRRLLPTFGLALTVVLAVIVLRPAPPDTRIKGGGLALRVFRAESGGHEVFSGSHFAPGDRLRFVVDLPAAGAMAVVGVEQGGALYRAWPAAEADVKQPAGTAIELPGAVALDEKLGEETLYLVHCAGASTVSTCTVADAKSAPACGSCSVTNAFTVKKP